VFNTYYAVVMNGYKPDKIYIFLENTHEEKLPQTVEALKIISEAYGFSPKIHWEIIEEDNFLEADEKIGTLLKTLKEKGHEISIDITPGEKLWLLELLSMHFHWKWSIFSTSPLETLSMPTDHT